MKKYLVPTILFMLSISFYFLYQAKVESIPSISYFPLDEDTSFTKTETELKVELQNKRKEYTIAWDTFSTSEESIYLRQDVSLLFKNGKLFGALSKWHESEDTINLSERIQSNGTGYYQSLSYHHGEIHYSNSDIKSIQQMTYDNLYVIEDKSSPIQFFESPKTKKESIMEKQLKNETSQTLMYHWNQLLNHYQVNRESYFAVPLTELYQYSNKKLPGLSQSKTNQIIGQLWEGIYTNYVVPATNKKDHVSSHVPIILFGKDNKHLIVLFEMNGEMERLIQQYP